MYVRNFILRLLVVVVVVVAVAAVADDAEDADYDDYDYDYDYYDDDVVGYESHMMQRLIHLKNYLEKKTCVGHQIEDHLLWKSNHLREYWLLN